MNYKRGLVVSALMIIIVVAVAFTHSGVAAAATLHPYPGGSSGEPAIPATPLKYFNDCVASGGGAQHLTPAMQQWVSIQGQPNVVTTTVDYGTASIDLDFNNATAICRSDQDTDYAKVDITRASAGVVVNPAAPSNKILNFPYNNFFGVNHQYDNGFYFRPSLPMRYSPAGGFTESGWHTIVVYWKAINHFHTPNQYWCYNEAQAYISGGTPANPWNFNGCPESGTTYSIYVTVRPKKVVNNEPTGSLAPTCGASSYIIATFGDADAPTDAQLRLASGDTLIKSLVASDSGHTKIDITNYIGFTTQTFNLYVRDTGPSGSGNLVLKSSVSVSPCPNNNGGAALVCTGATTDPTIVEPGGDYTVSASFKYSGGTPPAPSSRSIHITGPGGYDHTWVDGDVGYSPSAANASSGSIALSIGTPPLIPVSAAGTYTVEWSLTVGDITRNCVTGYTSPDGPPSVFQSELKPYVQIYGGDVSVGGGIPTVPAAVGDTVDCTVQNGDASIASWNNETTAGSVAYSGAGGQYGVHALKNILDFASNYGITSGTGRPTSLSFANTLNNSPSSGNFGGQSGASSVGLCDPTIVTGADAAGATLYTGKYKLSTLVASLPQPLTGSHTIYVKGSVLIDQDMTYAGASSGYGSVAAIPSFKLIVLGGDINISSSVGQLDGTYYAVPSASAGGNIYTCSDAGAANPYGDTAAITNTDNYASCGKQLVVNGTLDAKQIWFLRSCGTKDQASSETVGPTFTSGGDGNTDTCSASNHAAEVINFEPELWMPVVTGAGGSGSYRSIQNLPPVL